MIKRFIKFLENNLPKGYYSVYEKSINAVYIMKNTSYVYIFYEDEIENDFTNCCSLLDTIIEVTEE